MSTYLGYPVYDFFLHQPGVQDYPRGRGDRTTTAGSGIAPRGKKVVLHMCLPLNGFSNTTPINLTNGDGSVTYFTMVTPGNANGMSASMDIVLPDGLGVSGGSGGPWIISYRVIE